MIQLLYQVSIYGYSFLLKLISPFHKKAQLWVKGRQNWEQALREKLAQNNQPVAWFHAASLGEFEQGRPVIERFKKDYPDHFILLTFFSPSGYEIRKNYNQADYVCYLPADTSYNAQTFIKITKPAIAYFIKYEFWYNYLKELRAIDAKIISFSAIFRENQVFFKSYGHFYRNLLNYFDVILVQNDRSKQLLDGIHLTSTIISSGDTRFDRVSELPNESKDLPMIEKFVGNTPTLVVGSAWEEDMDIIIPVLNQLGDQLKVIIAPHEISSDKIESWRKQLQLSSIKYSELESVDVTANYLFIDNIGMLSSLYKYGVVAWIGGAYKTGLHNILEAATYGMPVLFGNKKYQKFHEAVSLLELGGAHTIATSAELLKRLEVYRDSPELLQKESQIAKQFVQSHKGATQQVMDVTHQLLN